MRNEVYMASGASDVDRSCLQIQRCRDERAASAMLDRDFAARDRNGCLHLTVVYDRIIEIEIEF